MNNTQKQFKVITTEETLNPMQTGAICKLDEEGHCITCSDEAQPASVLSVDLDAGVAFVTISDATEEIDITLVDDVAPGSVLLVHGGVAIANISNDTDGANHE